MSVWNLASVLAHHADRFGDRPCLVGLRLVVDGGEKMPLPLIERLLPWEPPREGSLSRASTAVASAPSS